MHQASTIAIQDSLSYQQQLQQLTHWTLEGKISVRRANTSDSVALQWQQANEYFDIFISGPMGAGATRIHGTPGSITLQNGEEISTSTDDPHHLIEKHLGWELPLENLPRWIKGQSDHLSVDFNIDHTIAGFREYDWQVEYLRYQVVAQWLLPEKIVLKHEDMQVTIFIKHWKLL